MVDYALYPICDTSMLIDLKHIDKFDEYLDFKKYICIADKVRDELVNKVKDLIGFEHYLNVLNKDNLILIEASKHFAKKKLKVIKANLKFFNFKNIVGTDKLVKDAGEFVSACYAIELGIKELITSDSRFIEEYEDEPMFKSLTMKDLNNVLRDFLGDNERIKCMSMIPQKNKKFNKAVEEKSQDLQYLLNELKNMYLS